MECLQCGKVIPRRKEKGHREREYCSDLCRKRAWRARNKNKYRIERIVQDARERMWNKIDQDVHRETWQDELERNQKQIRFLLDELKRLEERNAFLETQVTFLEHQLTDKLAEKEAEIARLTTLLESQQVKRKRS